MLNQTDYNSQSNYYLREIDKLQSDITQLTTGTTQIPQINTDVTNLKTDVTRLKTDTTDITYDLTSDTTTISNRFKIVSALKSTNANYLMLRVINTEATITNEARLYVSPNVSGETIGSNLAQPGDIVLQCYNNAT